MTAGLRHRDDPRDDTASGTVTGLATDPVPGVDRDAGGFAPRPISPATEWRPGRSVAKRPPLTQRRALGYPAEEIAALSLRLRDIPPHER